MLPCRTDLRANLVPPRCVFEPWMMDLLFTLSPTGVRYLIVQAAVWYYWLWSSQTKQIESLFKLPFEYSSVLRITNREPGHSWSAITELLRLVVITRSRPSCFAPDLYLAPIPYLRSRPMPMPPQGGSYGSALKTELENGANAQFSKSVRDVTDILLPIMSILFFPHLRYLCFTVWSNLGGGDVLVAR